MKVKIPSKTSEVTLKQYQFMMGTLNTNTERGEYLIKHFAKRDPDLFDDDTKAAVFLTAIKYFELEKLEDCPENLDDYKLPNNLMNIKVGHFIEIVNAEININSFENAEIVAGCLWRKDWGKSFDKDEIIDTALWFQEQPLNYTIWSVLKMNELTSMLRETFPLLYDDQVSREANIEPEEDDGRRLYDMLMGLTDKRFIDWDEAKDRLLVDSFVYLEEMKKEVIKQRLNEKNKGR